MRIPYIIIMIVLGATLASVAHAATVTTVTLIYGKDYDMGMKGVPYPYAVPICQMESKNYYGWHIHVVAIAAHSENDHWAIYEGWWNYNDNYAQFYFTATRKIATLPMTPKTVTMAPNGARFTHFWLIVNGTRVIKPVTAELPCVINPPGDGKAHMHPGSNIAAVVVAYNLTITQPPPPSTTTQPGGGDTSNNTGNIPLASTGAGAGAAAAIAFLVGLLAGAAALATRH